MAKTVKSLQQQPGIAARAAASTGEVVEVGVDYITAIGKTPESQQSMQALATTLLLEWHDAGNETRPWSMKGYEGFICGPIQVGTRQDSTLMRVTGGEADAQWERVWRISDAVTRVDLQVTLRPKIEAARLVARVRRQSCSWSNKRKDDPLVGWRGDNRGGATVYVGSRFSDRFGRCYVKGVESGLEQYDGTVRFEVQFQKKTCGPLLRSVHQSNVRMVAVAGFVSGFFRSRGVTLLLPAVPTHPLRISRRPSDLDVKLRWLRDQVSPSIRRLLDAGLYDEVVTALGLGPSIADSEQSSE